MAKKTGVSLKVVEFLSSLDSFVKRHRKDVRVFTRDRKLTFRSVLLLLLRKSVKSLQLVLNEWSEILEDVLTATAFSQARMKFLMASILQSHPCGLASLQISS